MRNIGDSRANKTQPTTVYSDQVLDVVRKFKDA